MLKTIVGLKFQGNEKIYYFDPCNLKLEKGDKIIVETHLGKECGTVVLENKEIKAEDLKKPLKKIVRKASDKDLKVLKEIEAKNKYAKKTCESLANKYNLAMKIIDAQYTFDKSKVFINFAADTRVDFRQLVKDLVAKLNSKVELKQIRFRDETKLIGGISHCGREFCCKSFMKEFKPVSIKMAKTQGISLTPSKISGSCGKLMCCLRHEQEAYEDILNQMPKIGDKVKTNSGEGKVVEISLISGNLKVKLFEKPEDALPICVKVQDIKIIK